jgi:hypothetical protein
MAKETISRERLEAPPGTHLRRDDPRAEPSLHARALLLAARLDESTDRHAESNLCTLQEGVVYGATSQA